MDTIVLKFGGSSVADNCKLNLVASKIIELVDEQNKVVVVVSAQGKKTDSLLNEAYEISDNPSNRELDVLLSTGEQVSISKLAIALNKLGYKAISLTGWQAGIYTNNKNQDAIIEHINTSRINTELNNGNIVIIAGFQGINENFDITTLGRGGSDTTAISVAAALDASCCYIYSDVEGVFSADPRKLENAIKLKNLSYDEMLEIANDGAKVLHNRCVEIGKKYNIPIIAKSTFKEDEGTIVDNKIEEQKIKSFVKDDDLIYVCINNESYLYTYKIFIEHNLVPMELSNNADKITALFKFSEFQKLKFIIQEELDKYCVTTKKISRISIVGHGISNNQDIFRKIIAILHNCDANVKRVDVKNSKIRITFDEVVGNEILKELHDKLMLIYGM